MAELSMVCVTTAGSANSNIPVNINKKTLIRTGAAIPKDTTVNINSPGAGWGTVGDTITFSGSTDFTGTNQFYHNGQLLIPGENSSTDNDIYFINSNSLAFEFPIFENDIIQIWQFTATSG